jgi:hypothetical protein
MGRFRLDQGERWLIATIVAVSFAMALAGCGHRELKAPCAPSDGAASIAAGPPQGVMALVPVEDRWPDMPPAIGPVPVRDARTDPCGPLRPLNAAHSVGGPHDADRARPRP